MLTSCDVVDDAAPHAAGRNTPANDTEARNRGPSGFF
jgi:hypothetical protein